MFKVKICGITNLIDYNLINHLGTDFSGFIFYKKSPRFIESENAAEIIQKGKSNSLTVGVFVNETAINVKKIYKNTGLDLVQLHGSESPEYCRELGLPYWKVLRVKTTETLKKMDKYTQGDILLDTFSPNQPGGTGIAFSEYILDEALKYNRNLIIAGGISEHNIEKIVSKDIYAIDLCSSVERIPGIKDEDKLRLFFKKVSNLKGANNE